MERELEHPREEAGGAVSPARPGRQREEGEEFWLLGTSLCPKEITAHCLCLCIRRAAINPPGPSAGHGPVCARLCRTRPVLLMSTFPFPPRIWALALRFHGDSP